MDGKFIAYYRVSTEHQGVNGNGMAAQRKAVEDYLNGGRWKLVAEFTEVECGKRNDRPELEKALVACRKHKAKLVIAKLDRLSRNVHFISGLMERKVDFVACDMPSANAFMINVYAAVAQEERRMISDRTKAGLQGGQGAWCRAGWARAASDQQRSQGGRCGPCAGYCTGALRAGRLISACRRRRTQQAQRGDAGRRPMARHDRDPGT